MSGPIKAVDLLMGTCLDEAGASSTDAEADSCQVYSVTSCCEAHRQAAQAGANGPHEGPGEGVQRGGQGQPLCRHHPRHQRTPRRVVEGVGAELQEQEDVQQPAHIAGASAQRWVAPDLR